MCDPPPVLRDPEKPRRVAQKGTTPSVEELSLGSHALFKMLMSHPKTTFAPGDHQAEPQTHLPSAGVRATVTAKSGVLEA